MLFDTETPPNVSLQRETGKVPIPIRWPNDEEWGERAKARKVIIKRLGRGVNETEIQTGTADLNLYQRIRLDGAPDLDSAEAELIIAALAQCDTNGVDVEGNEAVVTLTIPTGAVTHRLRLPTAKDVVQLRRSAFRLLDMPFNRQEIRVRIEPGAELWDKCHLSHQGYTNGVPALHKDTAIRAVIDYIDAEVTRTGDDSSF